MYLKEIEASGFKSFADKLKITLDDNITCIVGPNGSGKSNVVDAVRWVLGEQSVKSLRGDGGMTDVIFSGSKSRNALNVASVTLTFDNSDNYLNIPYSEVSIKRRVYRTLENEYFLNGEKCRLKDITNLFLDSGIGKESFNIISQGEVQKILSNSPYDRRVIFEEAAGVLKYKKRKEEAIRKLDRTHDNLDRAGDIIAELETQVEPLKEQSAKALEYLENKHNLEKIEVALIVYEIDLINETYQNNKQRIEELNNKIILIKNQTSDTKVDTSKIELLKLETELSKLNQDLLTITKEAERLNGEKNIQQERSKYDSNDSKVHDNIASLAEQKLKIENEYSLLEQELNIEQDYETKSIELVKNLTSELQLVINKKDNLSKEELEKERNINLLEHKIQVITNYLDNGGNLPNSVKAILNNPKLIGIYDVIGNLITVSEEYTKALEVSLGGSKQFLVVENEYTAKDAINYLKNNNLGRATFFPLSVIKPKGIDIETETLLKEEAGYINICANLVTYDNKFRNIILNQLGNVIVVNNIDSANRISKKINGRYKIVTLEGEIIHVGGSITGGCITSQRSMITDKLELGTLIRSKEELTRVIKELNDQLSSLDSEYNLVFNKLVRAKEQLFLTQETVKSKGINLTAAKESLNNTIVELNSLGHVIDSSLSKEEEAIINKYYEQTKLKESTLLKIKKVSKEKDDIKVIIEELEAKERLNNTELRRMEAELKELEIAVSRMDVKLDMYLNTLNEDYELTYEKAKGNYEMELELDEARNKVITIKGNIKRIGMVNLAAIQEYEKVRTRYEFLTLQRNDLLHAKETLLSIIEEMDAVMKEEFMTTFELIQKEFGGVFEQLFHGGHASLKLTEPSNILETGVEIIASPPGKKLTTISLLSGGEKTLTAISLLFAILNVRTVPFCLFDEVEAALDEANVDNFGKYLDHYKSKTQFLLITHKKKTMEYANTLYGITMQESGVSKLVSVRFDQENK
ncbi:MAG: AAA family ATPase [Bacilli bacterium]